MSKLDGAVVWLCFSTTGTSVMSISDEVVRKPFVDSDWARLLALTERRTHSCQRVMLVLT